MTTSKTTPQILVGVDGSTGSQVALQWASSFAASEGAELTALMAWNYPSALMVPMLGAASLPPIDFMEDAATSKLQAMIDASTDDGASVESRTVMGAARIVLTELSEDYDLVVLGQSGDSRLKRAMLGSTASYCVAHAECPIVIARAPHSGEQQITVAVDGSEASIDALAWGLGVGSKSNVLAVYSYDAWQLDDLPLQAEVRDRLAKAGETMLEDAVAKAIEKSGANPTRVTWQVRQGDPRTTIVDNAEPNELLVLGAQGHTGLARWALGSLADYAVQNAPGTVAIWH